jgi:hypothetical protein
VRKFKYGRPLASDGVLPHLANLDRPTIGWCLWVRMRHENNRMIGGALADLISPVTRQIVKAWRIAFGEEPGRSRPQAALAVNRRGSTTPIGALRH